MSTVSGHQPASNCDVLDDLLLYAGNGWATATIKASTYRIAPSLKGSERDLRRQFRPQLPAEGFDDLMRQVASTEACHNRVRYPQGRLANLASYILEYSSMTPSPAPAVIEMTARVGMAAGL